MKNIIIIVGLLAMVFSLTGCKPYKVLAGEMKFDNGGADYTIDKSKVEITLKEKQSVKIPFVIKNNEAEQLKFSISEKMPSVLTLGYDWRYMNGAIRISLSEQNIALDAYKSGKIDIEIIRSEGEAKPIEIWVSVKDNKPAMVNKELIMRILVNVKD